MGGKRVPWAVWFPIAGLTGATILGSSARKITLHTTEGHNLPNWASIRNVPHLTVNPATGEAWQHLDLDRAGYALASPGPPTSPNINAGKPHIQIEIIGFSEKVPSYSDKWYQQLAEWLVWLCEDWDIPMDFPFRFVGSQGYGHGGLVRQAWDEYAARSGIVGHSHAPYNTHWDRGKLDVDRLQKFMEEEMKLTESDIVAIALRVNRVLGDYNAQGQQDSGGESPLLADTRLTRIHRSVERIIKRLDRLEDKIDALENS